MASNFEFFGHFLLRIVFSSVYVLNYGGHTINKRRDGRRYFGEITNPTVTFR